MEVSERLKAHEVVQHHAHRGAAVAAVHEAWDVRVVEAVVPVDELRQTLRVQRTHFQKKKKMGEKNKTKKHTHTHKTEK